MLAQLWRVSSGFMPSHFWVLNFYGHVKIMKIKRKGMPEAFLFLFTMMVKLVQIIPTIHY